jgi:hypothetical protein
MCWRISVCQEVYVYNEERKDSEHDLKLHVDKGDTKSQGYQEAYQDFKHLQVTNENRYDDVGIRNVVLQQFHCAHSCVHIQPVVWLCVMYDLCYVHHTAESIDHVAVCKIWIHYWSSTWIYKWIWWDRLVTRVLRYGTYNLQSGNVEKRHATWKEKRLNMVKVFKAWIIAAFMTHVTACLARGGLQVRCMQSYRWCSLQSVSHLTISPLLCKKPV